MATEFKLPDLGENIESGDVVALLVKEGDVIEPNQPVVELETDKATVEVPCPIGGRVAKIHVQPGDTVPIGGVLLTLEEGGDAAAVAAATTTAASSSQAAVQTAAPPAASAPPATPAASGQPTTPPTVTEPVPPVSAPIPSEPAAPVGGTPPTGSTAPPTSTAPTAPSTPPPGGWPSPAEPASTLGTREIPPAAAAVPPEAMRPVTAGGRRTSAPAGPATRRLARELGVDLSQVQGTGPGGRITEEDVKAAVRRGSAQASTAGSSGATVLSSEPPAVSPAPTPAPAGAATPAAVPETTTAAPPAAAAESQDAFGPVRRERMSKIRQTIARNMARSASTIPHVTNFDDADITELDKIRRESVADYLGTNIKLTMMPFVMKAVAHALKAHPMLNASIDDEKNEIIFKQYVNIGVAVDTDRGLIVPVVRNVDHMTIPQIALALGTVAEQARSGQFSLDDLRGGTFTISNLGAIGGTYSTPIINHPEVAILLVGRSRRLPVAVDGQIEVRLMMPLSLSYDHRLVDGATAARFLNEVIAYLEAPGRLLLAP